MELNLKSLENNMIEELEELLPEVLSSIRSHLNKKDKLPWDSLVKNIRKPHVHNVFRMFGERRICLNVLHPCSNEESFAHPHSWPMSSLILKGEYVNTIGCSNLLTDKPKFIYREFVKSNASYEIVNPFIWHKIQPLSLVYAITMNGIEFEQKHEIINETKEELDKMEESYLEQHLTIFELLLSAYLT